MVNIQDILAKLGGHSMGTNPDLLWNKEAPEYKPHPDDLIEAPPNPVSKLLPSPSVPPNSHTIPPPVAPRSTDFGRFNSLMQGAQLDSAPVPEEEQYQTFAEEPNTDVIDRYRELINSRPEQQGTSKTRGVLALLAGSLGGFSEGASRGAALGQSVIDAPHEREMAAWKDKVGAAQQELTYDRHSQANQTKIYSIDKKAETQLKALKHRQQELQAKINLATRDDVRADLQLQLDQNKLEIERIYKQGQLRVNQQNANSNSSRASTAASLAPSQIEENKATTEWRRGAGTDLTRAREESAEANAARARAKLQGGITTNNVNAALSEKYKYNPYIYPDGTFKEGVTDTTAATQAKAMWQDDFARLTREGMAGIK